MEENINEGSTGEDMIESKIKQNNFIEIKNELADGINIKVENDSMDEDEDIKPSMSDIEEYSTEIKKEEQTSDEDLASEFSDDDSDEGSKDVKKNLIKAIKDRPELYDDSCRTENSQPKEAIWEEVAKDVNTTVEFCKVAWQNLTSRYTEIVENQIINGISRSRWKYNDDMLFYLPFCSRDGNKIIDNEDEQFKRKLIELVRDKYRELYDTKHPEFTRYARHRILIWYKVAEDMDCSAEKCRKTWNNLRFVFASQWSSRNNGRKCKKFRFEDLLEFLIPFIGVNTIPRSKRKELLDDEAFKRKLVKFVQEQPMVYTQPNLKKVERFALWKDIADKMDSDIDKCRKTWSFLRHHYGGVLRRRKLGQVVTWKYEKDLEFLFPYLIQGSLKHKKEIIDTRPEKSNFRFQLIEAVQKYPVLYDLEYSGYTRVEQVDTWEKVAEELKKPTLLCKTTWKTLKKGFRSVIVNKMKGGTQKWPFEEAMQFMWPYMNFTRMLKGRKNKQNKVDTSQEQTNVVETKENENAEPQDSENDDDNTQESSEIKDKDAFLQNVEFVKLFIETVKKYPRLYCHYNEQHLLSQEQYELTWRIVAKEVNWTASECVRAWRRLKQIYRKKDVKRNTDLEKWIYQDDLAFAKTYILNRDYPKQKRHDEDERYKSVDFRKLLIEVVKKYPAIYDPADENYHKTKYLRKEVWTSIAAEVNHSVKGCFGLWNYLVLKYRAGLVNSQLGDTSTESEKFEFNEELAFLKPYVEADNQNTARKIEVDTENCRLSEAELFKKKLIQIVKKYPPVYDCGHKDYRRASVKKLWENIAEEMNSSVTKCRDVWVCLRSNYRTVLKRRTSENYRKTKFEDDMEFFEPFLIKIIDTSKQKEVNSEQEPEDLEDYRFKLIEMVKEYPQLYDPSYMASECGGNWQQRKILWDKVAKELNRKADSCRDDWKHLKRTLKVVHTKPSRTPAKWKFHEEMKFMIPFIEGLEHVKNEVTEVEDENSQNEVDVFRESLIWAIRKHPVLYDETNKDLIQTKDAWEVVAQEVNSTAKECRTQWWRLKSFYRKFLQDKLKKPTTTWKYQNSMEFIKPQIINKVKTQEEELVSAEDDKESEHFKRNLIKVVKRYPELYDFQHETYGRPRTLAKTTWKTIAQEIGRPARECRVAWNILKFNYRKLLKGEMYNRQKWRFQDDMQFMLPYICTTSSPEKELRNACKEPNFTQRLIDLVKTKYTDIFIQPQNVDANTWEEVARELNASVEECKDTWKTLKQTYTILQQGKHSGYDVGVKWRYEESMTFLKPFLPQIGESDEDEDHKDKSISSIEYDQYETNEKLGLSPKRSCLDDNGPSTSKKQKTVYEEAMAASTNIDIKFIKFARSVEKLPQVYQDKLKQKIYKAVSLAEKNFNESYWEMKRTDLKKSESDDDDESPKEKIARNKAEEDEDPNYQNPNLNYFDENKLETENVRRSSRIRKNI